MGLGVELCNNNNNNKNHHHNNNKNNTFLFSNFRRVLNVMCSFLGNSPASEF